MNFGHRSCVLILVCAALMLGSISGTATGADIMFHARDEAARARKAGILLVRIEGEDLASINAMMDGQVAGYRLRPLFSEPMSITSTGRQVVWLVATSDNVAPLSDSGGWDRAHRFLAESRESYQFKGAESVYVEPNVEHRPVAAAVTKPLSAAGTIGAPPIGKPWPKPPSFAWHLGYDYSQLKKAREIAGKKGACLPRVTILDTGIHSPHTTKPRGIDIAHARNFVEGGNNVEDPGNTGMFKHPGHGTATMALLAGNRISLTKPPFDDDLGGAPDAKVVPVRIADSVIHFWTDEMAQGIDYVTTLPTNGQGGYCDVVSISMGGVAARSWAHAVNKAYEKGVTIVAAAGNNKSNAPTRFTVYPSRFARVITVTGATSEHKPYRANKFGVLQGNYGPPSVMRKAIAAYTPNVPWAAWGTKDTIDLDGNGTSAAAPQVAAAAVLWLQTYADKFKGDWERVEAVRHALFTTAEKRKPTEADSKKFYGNGLLRAADALDFVPDRRRLQKQPEDEVSFPFLRILLGWDEPNEGRQRMYEVEALNLVLESRSFSPLAVDQTDDELKNFGPEQKDRLINYLVRHPRASRPLKEFISDSFGRK